jgi:hypothetical protein
MKELIKSMAVWFIMLGISWSKNIPYDIELKVHEIFSTVQFVENKGIYSNEVLYFSTSRNVFILKDGTIIANGIELKFGEPKEIKLDMLTPVGFSYFSNDKAWDLETYARVVLKSAYKNIDVMLTSLGKNQLEFQFIVKPKANVNDIKLIINNAESIEEGKDFIRLKKTCTYERPRILNEDEEEYPKEIDCSIYIKKPEAYQGSEEIKVHYEIRNNVLSYKVEKYDKNKTLIIDPTAILTGSSDDYVYALAIDNSGNVFVGGYTRNSSDFATNRVIYGTIGSDDAFVVKLSNNLDTLYRTAILTSSSGDIAYALAIDNSGNVFVGGWTWNSSNFADNRVIYGTTGSWDAFVVKLSNNLDTLYRTAILASSDYDFAYTLTIDNSGNVFVGGHTYSPSNFATNRVIYGTIGGADAFVVKLSNGLDTLYRTAILTSSSGERAYALAIDNSGNVFVGGSAGNSSNFATNRVIYGTIGVADAFVVKLSNGLDTLYRTAILASSSGERAYALAIDNSGNVFVGGYTRNSSDFADNRVIYGTIGLDDAFVVKLSNDLNTLYRTAILASTSAEDGVWGLYVSPDGSYVLASSATYDANNVGGAVSRYWCGDGGIEDIFIARLSGDLNNLQKIVIATGDGHEEIGVLKVYGNYVYVAGYTSAYTLSTYPDLALGNQYTYGTSGGNFNAFVISPRCEPVTPVEVEEKPQTQNEVIEIRNGKLFVKILSPKYIGFDVYEINGRIIYSKSLGFLPIGEYSYKLNLNKGSYIMKVRIGEEIRILKLVL